METTSSIAEQAEQQEPVTPLRIPAAEASEATRQAAIARLQQAYSADGAGPVRRDWRDRVSAAGSTGVLVVFGLIAVLVVGGFVAVLVPIVGLLLRHNALATLVIVLFVVGLSLGFGAQARSTRAIANLRAGQGTADPSILAARVGGVAADAGRGRQGALSMAAGLELEAAEAQRIKEEQNN